MYESYIKLFELSLDICQSMYNPERPYENLDKCISICEHSYWKLYGMLELMEETGAITKTCREKETQRLLDTFSSIKLFRAYKEDGEVMVFVKQD